MVYNWQVLQNSHAQAGRFQFSVGAGAPHVFDQLRKLLSFLPPSIPQPPTEPEGCRDNDGHWSAAPGADSL